MLVPAFTVAISAPFAVTGATLAMFRAAAFVVEVLMVVVVIMIMIMIVSVSVIAMVM